MQLQTILFFYNRGRNQRKDHDDSDFHEEDHTMTEFQKEEEQLIKQTFGFYERNKGGTQVELFELPMLLEGKLILKQTVTI